MKQVKYILVHETVRKNAVCDVTYRDEPHLGYCCYVSCPDIDTLVNLRKHWPETPILGVSEIDCSASHAPVHVSEAMNRLRRELSEDRVPSLRQNNRRLGYAAFTKRSD